MKYITTRLFICFVALGAAFLHKANAEPADVYKTYCGACHGPDGKGIPGAFPPLKGSQWIRGDVNRPIQIILHGIKGPIEVKNVVYDLQMPPQGQTLTDQQIAEIVTYITKEFSDKAQEVTPEMVAKARKVHDLKDMWTAKELKSHYPLPWKRKTMENLISYVYKGEFKSFPDFSKMEADAVEEEHKGIINTGQSGIKNGSFAMAWEGDLFAKESGDHTFLMGADDGAKLYVNGTKVIDLSEPGDMDRQKKGTVKLEKGKFKIRIEYFQHTGEQGVSFGYSGPGFWGTTTLSDRELRTWPDIPIIVNDRPRIYRNFYKGQSARGIGFGLPGESNIVYNADLLGLGMLWKGEFIDAGRHWTNRGQGAEKPKSKILVNVGWKPMIASLETPESKWPDKLLKNHGFRFKGYTLDAKGYPTFKIKVGEAMVLDQFTMSGDKMLRKINVENSDKLPANTYIRLSNHNQAQAEANGAWKIGGAIQLTAENKDQLISLGGFLVVPLSGSNSTTLTYDWIK